MGMVVQHNLNALGAYNKLNANVAGMKKSSEKLSSGYRINRAGDDAAGLAISEKMRSQIKGLNQAIRNSQDGISMIQTFEGAAQETHAILQRMKELATESANGTYDNATDRAAIQLEFDQLNDELNQIADTDFNGTIVLNGGQMADGLKAVNGEFNYATAARDPKQLATKDINTLDNNVYDVDIANTAWGTWSDSKYDRTDDDTDVTNQGPDSVDITFTYDGEGGWKATGVSDGGFDLDKINDTITAGTADAKNNGGFVLTDGTNQVANVIVDTNDLIKGDTITLTVTNPSVKNSTSMNFGIATDGIGGTYELSGAAATTGSEDPDAAKIVASAEVESTYAAGEKMTADTKALLDALNGATIEVTYTAGAVAATGYKITLADGSSVTTTGGADNISIGGKTVGTVTAAAGAAGAAGKLTFEDADGNELAVFTAAKGDANGDGTMTYKIANDAGLYDKAATPAVSVKVPADASVSESNSYGNSTAIMTYSENITLQTGARTKDSVNFTFNYNVDGSADMGTLKANLNISAREDGLNTANLSLANQDDANYAIDQIDKAINKVSMVRASFGSIQNRLEHKITNLTTTSENLTAAESTIRDTDMASEMMNYTKFNILQQAAQSMLAQANQQPQSILQLLG